MTNQDQIVEQVKHRFLMSELDVRLNKIYGGSPVIKRVISSSCYLNTFHAPSVDTLIKMYNYMDSSTVEDVKYEQKAAITIRGIFISKTHFTAGFKKGKASTISNNGYLIWSNGNFYICTIPASLYNLTRYSVVTIKAKVVGNYIGIWMLNYTKEVT